MYTYTYTRAGDLTNVRSEPDAVRDRDVGNEAYAAHSLVYGCPARSCVVADLGAGAVNTRTRERQELHPRTFAAAPNLNSGYPVYPVVESSVKFGIDTRVRRAAGDRPPTFDDHVASPVPLFQSTPSEVAYPQDTRTRARNLPGKVKSCRSSTAPSST